MRNFQAWVARVSSATLTDLIDVLAVQLRERDIGDHEALRQAAEGVRVHHATRVQQLVDALLVVELAIVGLGLVGFSESEAACRAAGEYRLNGRPS